MAAGGNDVLSHCNDNDWWWPKASSTGAPYFGLTFTYGVDKYPGKIDTVEFPASAYGPLHFHCERSLNSWNDGMTLNAGWLVGLSDLAMENDYVRDRIATSIVENLQSSPARFLKRRRCWKQQPKHKRNDFLCETSPFIGQKARLIVVYWLIWLI